MGDNASKKIRKEYNIDINAEKYLKVYQDVEKKYHEFFGKKKYFLIDNKGIREFGAKGKKKR